MNRFIAPSTLEEVEAELRLLVAEYLRRLSVALRDGDLDTARRLWHGAGIVGEVMNNL